MKQRLLTVRETSEFLNVSQSFLYHLVAARQLRHVKLGRKVLFDIKYLERYIEESSRGEKDWSEILDRRKLKK